LSDTVWLSQSAYDRLQAELDHLKTTGREEAAAAIKAARAHGDLRENAEYDTAKDEQGKMEARIRQVQAILDSAEIVDTGATGGVVGVGSVVAIRYAGDDDVERYLVGSIEERHADLEVVSPSSPLGQALMGSSPGASVSYEAPGGLLEVEIVSVEA
jgi:transcription elongation factor GreA